DDLRAHAHGPRRRLPAADLHPERRAALRRPPHARFGRGLARRRRLTSALGPRGPGMRGRTRRHPPRRSDVSLGRSRCVPGLRRPRAAAHPRTRWGLSRTDRRGPRDRARRRRRPAVGRQRTRLGGAASAQRRAGARTRTGLLLGPRGQDRRPRRPPRRVGARVRDPCLRPRRRNPRGPGHRQSQRLGRTVADRSRPRSELLHSHAGHRAGAVRSRLDLGRGRRGLGRRRHHRLLPWDGTGMSRHVTSANRPKKRVRIFHGRMYFALQALAGAAWWLGISMSPRLQTATLGGIDPLLIAVIDIPLFVIGSALAALNLRWAVWIATGWTVLVAAGMVVYATATTEAGLGAVLMILAALGSLLAGPLILLGRIPSDR